MSKKAIVAVLVILLAGGGIAFADYSPQAGLFGLTTASVEDENVGNDDTNTDVVTDADDDTDSNDNGDQMSEVAKAVHEALSGDSEIGPGHEEFGEKVSEQARDKDNDTHLEEEVSAAARKANGSYEKENGNDYVTSDSSGGNSSPGNSGNAFGNSSPGNSGNAFGNSSPGNSGNAGGNAGGRN